MNWLLGIPWRELLGGASETAFVLLALGAEIVLLSCLLFAFLYPLCRLCDRRFPAVSHALWLLLLLRLLLPADLTHPYSLASLARPAVDAFRAHDETDSPALPLNSDALAEISHPVISDDYDPPLWALGVAALWLLGSAGTALLGALRRRDYRRILRRAEPIRNPELLRLAHLWSGHFRIRRRVRLCTSNAPVSPFTMGFVHPVIFLPKTLLDRPRASEAALAHELAHVARGDSLVLGLEQLTRCFYFFHPVVWLASWRLDQQRESLCDAMVLARGTLSPRDYAASLLGVAELRLRGLATLNLIHPKRRWHMRLSSILERSSRTNPLQPGKAALLTLGLGLFLLPLATSDKGQAAPLPDPVENATQDPVVWSNPLPGGRITAGWGEMKDPWSGELREHEGIDVAANTGTPILAPRTGRVEIATTSYQPSAAYGTVVILDHGEGLKSFYAHLGTLEVEEGQRIERGEMIARVGSTGRSTGPHLHFEAWVAGSQIDPALWIVDWR